MDGTAPRQLNPSGGEFRDLLPAKVLFTTGSERNMRVFSDALRQRYAQVDIIVGISSSEVAFLSWRGSNERRIAFHLPRVQRHAVFAYQWALLLRAVLASAFHKRYDLCIATGIQATIFGLILRGLGVVRRTIYYASDWYPRQPVLQLLDRACCTLADAAWDPTPTISAARRARWPDNARGDPTLISSLLGPRAGMFPEDEPKEHAVCYLGAIRPEAGLDLIVRALALLRKRGTDIVLNIIGESTSPSYREHIDEVARESGISDLIRFLGFLKDEEMLSLLSRSLCGLCLMPGGEANYSSYPVPRKLMDYIECGIPAILSRSSYMTDELVPRNAAIAVGDSVEEVADAIRFFAEDPQRAARYGQNAYHYAQEQANPRRLFEEIEKVLPIRAGGQGLRHKP